MRHLFSIKMVLRQIQEGCELFERRFQQYQTDQEEKCLKIDVGSINRNYQSREGDEVLFNQEKIEEKITPRKE